ncbi:MAG: protein-export chaperone SecB, partial [Proteobacteria bacterium]|nr:protein-export chaperone SecB [Pseudomonadota bacterium]
AQAAQLNVLAQYIKDFSFENPNAPRSLVQQQLPQAPQINIQINVDVHPIAATDYEVELKLEGKAEVPDLILFAFDLVYAGVFRVQNIAQENMGPVLMIECPRLLFPFAREIIASSVINSGFPPLLLEPVDFVAIYQQKIADMQKQQAPQQNA